MAASPVPVLLVTGFLGAGKTTVVNHILAEAGGRRIAAVVNDFGAINIDAELIAGATDGVVNLANGCICCTLEGDLLRTLANLLRRQPRPEAIVIETSGVADPADIVRNLMDPVMLRDVPLETVLCVVDASASAEALADPLLRAQLRMADVVALTKTDLAGEAGPQRVRAAVTAIRPAATVVEAPQGRVPLPLVLPEDPARPRPPHAPRGPVRNPELDGGGTAVSAPPASRHRTTGTPACACQRYLRDRGAARPPLPVPTGGRPGDAGADAGRHSGCRAAARPHRLHRGNRAAWAGGYQRGAGWMRRGALMRSRRFWLGAVKAGEGIPRSPSFF
jgi:Ni2+-binding GTPase involved in maturation of urease and hydrogenase